MKIFIWSITCVFVLIVVSVVLINFGGKNSSERSSITSSSEYILNYIKEHPAQSSIVLVHNGERIVDVRGDQEMPLASTVKILIAIEYAKQAAAGTVQANEPVDIPDLEKYYLANLDGGAHTNWLKHMKKQNRIIHNTVTLEEVAKGMIDFSSNANTEYLIWKLGLENINNNVQQLDLEHHEEVYPFVSSLLIPYELMKNSTGSKEEKIRKVKEQLKNMSDDEYRQKATDIHVMLTNDSSGSYKKEANIRDWYDQEFDRMNSERFIKSTTGDYVSILQKLNSKKYFTDQVYERLEAVMEGIMTHPKNQEWLLHAGRKGGSTDYVFTEAMYATDKQGNRTELALFFNELNSHEFSKLSAGLNEFELKILRGHEFLEYIVAELVR